MPLRVKENVPFLMKRYTSRGPEDGLQAQSKKIHGARRDELEAPEKALRRLQGASDYHISGKDLYSVAPQ